MASVIFIGMFLALYAFAGYQMGQLVNLVDRERGIFDGSMTPLMIFFWLPVALFAMIEFRLKKKGIENEIWIKSEIDRSPNIDVVYPWEEQACEQETPSET